MTTFDLYKCVRCGKQKAATKGKWCRDCRRYNGPFRCNGCGKIMSTAQVEEGKREYAPTEIYALEPNEKVLFWHKGCAD
jgi:DNA-directed RNA polymerase subunit RPC12/RpoP